MRADLHLHSRCSDGALTPTELVRALAAHGVGVFALTDHDTVAGLAEARDTARELGLRLVPGVEISAAFEEQQLHVLGLGFDPEHAGLGAALRAQEVERDARVGRLVARLNELGVPVSEVEVRAAAGAGNPGRLHVARALVARGAAKTTEEAFERWLGDRAPGFVPKPSPTPAQAIGWIHEAGGVAVWAHPLAKPIERSGGFPALARELARVGLDGLELVHPSHDPTARARVRRSAAELGLLLTGGSDFHGGPGESLEVLGPEEFTHELWGALLSRLVERC